MQLSGAEEKAEKLSKIKLMGDLIMDLQEATIAMAALMKGEADFFKEHLDEAKPETDEEKKRYGIATKEFEWLKSNTREFGNILAANPHFFGVMESWKVVIKGTQGVAKESMEEALKTADVDNLIDRSGNLAINIKRHVIEKGLIICDMSAGEDGWDISIRCTEKNSRLLCFDINKQFSRALEIEILSISRRFAGHCLPGLYSWNDAHNFLKICGI
jgi:hypothetical protein